MANSPQQLSLGVSLNEDTTFANFWLSPNNAIPVAALKSFALGQGDRFITVWASRGAGLTHLLQACCHQASATGLSAQYLPLSELIQYSPEDVLDGLEGLDLVCVDNAECLCGIPTWEQAFFHLFNRLKDGGNQLLLAFSQNPSVLTWGLADLKSRVLGCAVYHLYALKDEELQHCLQQRAAARGMSMTEEVAVYILSRVSRDAHSVFAALDKLDSASLEHKRKLTVPFVKSVFGW